MIAMARVRHTKNILGFMVIAERTLAGLWAGRSLPWSAASGWSSCVFLRTEFRFTSAKPRLTPWVWIPKKTCAEWKKFYACNGGPHFNATSPRGRQRRLVFRSQDGSEEATRPSVREFFRQDSARPAYSSTK